MKMGKEILTFGNIEIEKTKFTGTKVRIFQESISIQQDVFR